VSPTIAAVGERELIDRIERRVGRALPSYVRLGIGDDAAVIRPERGTEDVITTDALVENVHFRRDWTSARAIGHKALAVNLSDLAAMGATPRASLLSLAMPASFPLEDFDALVEGYAALAAQSGAVLIGGNVARSPGPLMVDVTAVGAVRPRRLLRRAGARPGHALYVTGQIGSAATGLALLEAGRPRETMTPDELACLERYEAPTPRLRFSGIVAKTGAASACIDLSDGLADAAKRLADAAGIGVLIHADELQVNPAAQAQFGIPSDDGCLGVCSAGEDYELAFAVAPRQERRFRAAIRRCPELLVHRAGVFEANPGARLDIGAKRLALSGPEFVHF
jgi:thiamine-monophosphate kinase